MGILKKFFSMYIPFCATDMGIHNEDPIDYGS